MNWTGSKVPFSTTNRLPKFDGVCGLKNTAQFVAHAVYRRGSVIGCVPFTNDQLDASQQAVFRQCS
jgi:hypothetical protein